MTLERENNCSATCCRPLPHTIGKVAGFLSGSINRNGRETRPVTLTGISFLLDTNPEMINESLLSLRELGVIKLERRRIVIRDREMLQNIAVSNQ